MIVVLFGQPNSGKTTLANYLTNPWTSKHGPFFHIDGDLLRHIFKNKDFTRQGRLNNLKQASDTAVILESTGIRVMLSLIYPYKEARNYLNSLTTDVIWIYLTYDEPRGREMYHVKDFDIPTDIFTLNTSNLSIPECIKLIQNEIDSKISRR
jgi:adenylylsulfate kinase-like enzyme